MLKKRLLKCKKPSKKLKLKRKRLLSKRRRLRKNSPRKRLRQRWPRKPQHKLLLTKKKLRRQLPTGKSRLRKPKLRQLKRWPPLRSLLKRRLRNSRKSKKNKPRNKRRLSRSKPNHLQRLRKLKPKLIKLPERPVSNKRKNKLLSLSNRWPREKLNFPTTSPMSGQMENQESPHSSSILISVLVAKRKLSLNYSKTKSLLTSKSFQVASKDSFTTMKVIWTPESNSSSLLVPSTTTALKNSELSPATSPQAKNILRVIMVFQLSTLLPIQLALVAKSTSSGPLNRPPKTRTHQPSAPAKRLKRRNQRVMLKSNSRLPTKTKKTKKKRRMMMRKKKPPKSDQYIYIFKVFKKTFL